MTPVSRRNAATKALVDSYPTVRTTVLTGAPTARSASAALRRSRVRQRPKGRPVSARNAPGERAVARAALAAPLARAYGCRQASLEAPRLLPSPVPRVAWGPQWSPSSTGRSRSTTTASPRARGGVEVGVGQVPDQLCEQRAGGDRRAVRPHDRAEVRAHVHGLHGGRRRRERLVADPGRDPQRPRRREDPGGRVGPHHEHAGSAPTPPGAHRACASRRPSQRGIGKLTTTSA